MKDDFQVALPSTKASEYKVPDFKQSANVLFNFMPKLDYLQKKLTYMAMIPRYYQESIEYLNIESFDQIGVPMVCFCDIPLSKLSYHTGEQGTADGYGRYGIGMSKAWGITNGVQKIQYLTESSPYWESFVKALDLAVNNTDDEIPEVIVANNFLLMALMYMKPLSGSMFKRLPDGASSYISKNFHDEQEWRFIPDFERADTELPQVIPSDLLALNVDNKVCDTHSEGVMDNEKLWLKFSLDDIEYLIVDTKSDSKDLIRFILNELKISDDDKYDLISKINVFSQLEKDW